MQIVVVGLNHKSAPVAIREQIAFAPERQKEALGQLLESPEILEGLLLSTCNRVEIYACSHDGTAAANRLKSFLAEFHGLAEDTLTAHLYEFHAEQAIRHLFRVAASLDSMVIGEPQILGQLKEAFAVAEGCRSIGLILTRLLHKTFSVAKRVRSETSIACQAVSISYSAVELARKIFGSLQDRSVMIIGAGEMCELAARHLLNHKTADLLVANRTFERALQLAKQFDGRAVPFSDFPDYLPQVDIVLASTAATGYLLTRNQVEKVIRQRKNRPMFFIDIAVPRNIEPAVNQVDNAYLYDIDDLQNVIDANVKERRKAADKAEAIIDQEIGRFQRWLNDLELTPTIRDLQQRLEGVRLRELDKTFAQLQNLEPEERQAIEACTGAIIKKILHQPIAVLKERRHDMSGEQYLDAVRILFGLDGETEDEDQT
ncbi:MAG: glutamyl-tRNA reductase [Desulfuromonadales bacterium C00003094]|nr:MAG: glutamyl-tRNA reductase [Desulfuromonadales bacterium C00003094]